VKPKRFSTEEAEEFKARFYYDGHNLRFKKKVRGKEVGDLVGSPCSRGYRQVAVLGRKHLVHRIIYFMLTAEEPPCVDHIDGNPSNNSENNLRAATKSENCFNKKHHKGKGYRRYRNGKFEVYASEGNKYKSLGYFNTEEEAKEARKRYEHDKYGDFC
jgi:hypothetical protein